MADPPAADETPPDDPWDPLQAEYEDTRAQERERNHRVYLKRIKRELGNDSAYRMFVRDEDGNTRMIGYGRDDDDG